ncbi:hypothetical protein TIFTF001_020798 [Ficus carica]|uniref:Uncharacterized protein n=1 Tax=Ficus carica TaxID=3494 RepID=A0AA88A9D0_FICCA|nr:hypothetical protein TIFTF001_020798 [Ficus carica]
MPKISGTTPDVTAWSNRSCTVTMRQVTCKREAPRSDEDIGGVSAMGTPMLNRVNPLAFPMGRQASGTQALQAAEVGDGTGVVEGYALDVRRWIECCDGAPPPARARYHVQRVACPGWHQRPRILPNPGTRQILRMW